MDDGNGRINKRCKRCKLIRSAEFEHLEALELVVALFLLGALGRQLDLGRAAVVAGDGEALGGDVQSQVLAHHAQTEEANFRELRHVYGVLLPALVGLFLLKRNVGGGCKYVETARAEREVRWGKTLQQGRHSTAQLPRELRACKDFC